MRQSNRTLCPNAADAGSHITVSDAILLWETVVSLHVGNSSSSPFWLRWDIIALPVSHWPAVQSSYYTQYVTIIYYLQLNEEHFRGFELWPLSRLITRSERALYVRIHAQGILWNQQPPFLLPASQHCSTIAHQSTAECRNIFITS